VGLAGALSVVGYVVIQPKPGQISEDHRHLRRSQPSWNAGLLGGLVAVVVTPGLAKAQLIGIVLTWCWRALPAASQAF